MPTSTHPPLQQLAAGDVPASPAIRVVRAPAPTSSTRKALLLLAPALLLFALFVVWPLLAAILNSFRLQDFAGRPLGGLTSENYARILGDDDFVSSLVLTAAFTAVKVPLQLLLGLALALVFFDATRLNRFVRAAVALPSFVPLAIIGVLFVFLFDTSNGVVNAVLGFLHLPEPAWLQTEWGARAVVLLASLWSDTGLIMLVFVAGLAAVPAPVVEASRMDGASPLQTLRLVVLPLLRRSVQFAAVLSTLLAVQIVVPVLLITQGGPQRATAVTTYDVYRRAFDFFDWGPSYAGAVVLLVGVLAVTLAEVRLLRARWEW